MLNKIISANDKLNAVTTSEETYGRMFGHCTTLTLEEQRTQWQEAQIEMRKWVYNAEIESNVKYLLRRRGYVVKEDV
jgi:hypothetical protein